MKPKAFLILAAFLGVLVFWITNRESSNSSVDVAALAREKARRDSLQQSNALASQSDLSVLAKEGKGQPLPEYLATDVDPSGKFWLVGNPASEFGVEIPFEPGTLPAKKSKSGSKINAAGYLGAESCQECHADKYDTFIHTAHHQTSRLASLQEITGPLNGERSQMRTLHPEIRFEMLERDDTAFQRVSFFDWQFEVPMQLIMGSSKMAETYLYWHGEKLFQLNCTYLTEPDAWINSPGYLDGDAAYARPIISGCLDCHSTYVELKKEPNLYATESLILGISCERCHGPGQQHVDYHRANPNEKKSEYMVVPSKLSREREMDVCGQCHMGNKAPKAAGAFQFRPGDRIEEHYELLEDHDESANSVHASNQIGRLALSACFQESEMACVQCHNPHKNERGMTEVFSQRCLKCHQENQCGMHENLGPKLRENCIDCHMPKRATDKLRVETSVGQIFPPLRDHHIRVDQKATENYLKSN